MLEIPSLPECPQILRKKDEKNIPELTAFKVEYFEKKSRVMRKDSDSQKAVL